MFFIFGFKNGDKKISYNKSINCSCCKKETEVEIYMRYNQLFLFFLPFLKFNKKYYLKCNNCKSIFLLEKNIGKKIIKDKNSVIITDEDLSLIKRSNIDEDNIKRTNYKDQQRCINCGELLENNFNFCPGCGQSLI